MSSVFSPGGSIFLRRRPTWVSIERSYTSSLCRRERPSRLTIRERHACASHVSECCNGHNRTPLCQAAVMANADTARHMEESASSRQTAAEHLARVLDCPLEETFPASDPVAVSVALNNGRCRVIVEVNEAGPVLE